MASIGQVSGRVLLGDTQTFGNFQKWPNALLGFGPPTENCRASVKVMAAVGGVDARAAFNLDSTATARRFQSYRF